MSVRLEYLRERIEAETATEAERDEWSALSTQQVALGTPVSKVRRLTAGHLIEKALQARADGQVSEANDLFGEARDALGDSGERRPKDLKPRLVRHYLENADDAAAAAAVPGGDRYKNADAAADAYMRVLELRFGSRTARAAMEAVLARSKSLDAEPHERLIVRTYRQWRKEGKTQKAFLMEYGHPHTGEQLTTHKTYEAARRELQRLVRYYPE
jgi:hypothetical protein